MDDTTYVASLAVLDHENLDQGNPPLPIPPGSPQQEPQALTPCGCDQLDDINAVSVAESAPSQDVLEIVPDSIVMAELGSSPHCLPAHWPRKAPAP